MTCRDCIHWEVCNWVGNDDRHRNNGCNLYFKDKKRYVELPCKIGDIIYVIRLIDKKIMQDRVKDFEIWSISDGIKVRIEVVNNKDYIIGQFGRDIFLNREEAEKALEEMKEK